MALPWRWYNGVAVVYLSLSISVESKHRNGHLYLIPSEDQPPELLYPKTLNVVCVTTDSLVGFARVRGEYGSSAQAPTLLDVRRLQIII